MGLDMYLMDEATNTEIGYWRKHPNLHGYIVNTFANGVDECQKIPLSEDDIKNIIQAVKTKSLPHTTGFFFGSSDGSEDKYTIDTFNKALDVMNSTPKSKRSIYYQASW